MKPKVLIIGAGPAALTASIYLSRGGTNPLLLERETLGGQLADCPKIENFPGFEGGLGSDLADKMANQAMELGAEFEMDEVLSLKKEGNKFIALGNYGTYEGEAAIIATGAKHRHLNCPGEKELSGKGVSYCALCDGAFYKDEDVAVIGDANTAMQYALLLSKTSKSVTLITLFDRFFGEKSLQEAVLATPNIKVIHEADTKAFIGKESLEAIEYRDLKSAESKRLPVKGAFVAIGMVPDNERFASLVDLENGYIKVDGHMATKTEGLYAVGDCRTKDIRQVVTAVNDGAIAALDILSDLSTKN